MRSVRHAVLAVGFALVVGLSACGGSSETVEAPTFGTRAEEEGRETLLIAPPEAEEEFFYYPAFFSDIEVRAGAVQAGRRPVELLIRGALPDGCTELHHIGQERRGNLIGVTFEMRKPKGAVCTQVVRPYRFYYTFEQPLEPGDYTLTLNDTVKPFTVQPARGSEVGG